MSAPWRASAFPAADHIPSTRNKAEDDRKIAEWNKQMDAAII
jgi:hypothetical protein